MRFCLSIAGAIALVVCMISPARATVYAPKNNIQKMSEGAKLVIVGTCVEVKEVTEGREVSVVATMKVKDDGVIKNTTQAYKDLKAGGTISFKQFKGLKSAGGRVARTSLLPYPFEVGKEYVIFLGGKEDNLRIQSVYDGVFHVQGEKVTSKRFGKLFKGLTPSATTTKALKAAGVGEQAPTAIELNGFKSMIKTFGGER